MKERANRAGIKSKSHRLELFQVPCAFLPLFSLFPFPLSFPYQSTTNWYSVRIIHFHAYSRLLLQSEPRTGTGAGDATGTGAPTRAFIASSLPRPEPCDFTSQQATLFFIIITQRTEYQVLRMTQPNKLCMYNTYIFDPELYRVFRPTLLRTEYYTPQCSEYGQFCYALLSHTCERSTP